jgi:type II secretory pathway pseudopilin PulG
MRYALRRNGFSLIEAIVAAAVVAAALAHVAHLLASTTSRATRARDALIASVLAQAKLEELRAATWRFDTDGARLSDESLALAPVEALSEDVPGWMEELDRFGAPADDQRPLAYRRRWAVTLLDMADADTLVLQACVFRATRDRTEPLPDACLEAVRTRQP